MVAKSIHFPPGAVVDYALRKRLLHFIEIKPQRPRTHPVSPDGSIGEEAVDASKTQFKVLREAFLADKAPARRACDGYISSFSGRFV